MLPRSFLSQLTLPRVAEALRRLEAQIWIPLDASGVRVEQTMSFREHRRVAELADADFAPLASDRFHWGPKYAQRWFRLRLPALGGEPVHLRWNDQAEATAYIEGVPYCGLDLAHRFCRLPAGARETLIESVCIKTGIWLDGQAAPLDAEGSAYRPPELFRRRELAWSCFHDLKVLSELIETEMRDTQNGHKKKDAASPVRHTPGAYRATPLFRRLCHRLEAAIDRFDQGGLAPLAEALAAIYADFPAAPGALEAVLTGHAHIDLVWLWPERVGEFKAVHSWATQLRLMERYEEYRFGFSQPACYEAVRRRAPELYAQMRARLAEGRWEATGGSLVESDTQLPCGESLLRSLRLGQAGFRRLRGEDSSVFWLPDVFGYSGVMPQLLRGFGIESFFTTKLSWSTINQFPHSSFRWRGYDGSEVRSHVVLLHDYNEAVDLRNLREDALHHQQAAVHPEFLVPTGYGDGGGGPTEEMCERARRVANLAGVPKARWGSIEAFFERLADCASELPVVAGELPLELHRGVFTTHGALKAAFRGLERALQIQEAVHAARGLPPIGEEAWRRLVLAQFHDYVPGSSIWEVYAEGVPELLALAEQAMSAAGVALEASARSGQACPSRRGWGDLRAAQGESVRRGVSFHSEAVARRPSALAVAPDARAAQPSPPGVRCLFNPLPEARRWIEDGNCFELPPLGGGPLATLPRWNEAAPVVDRLTLRSAAVEAAFSPSGGIVRLSIQGQEIALDGPGHTVVSYPDNPAMFEAWDVDRSNLVHGQIAEVVGEPERWSDGVQVALAFNLRVGQSAVRVAYSLRVGEPVLRIEYAVDWRDPAHLLKAVFATGYRGREARYGAPFGSVLRNQWPGYAREEALWEVPASRWMAVMDDAQREGLSVITEAKYGFSVRDGVVGLSLLRSALVTEADLHPEIRETPNRPRFSDLGPQRIQVALGAYAATADRAAQPAALADSLFTPCLPYRGDAIESGLLAIEGAPSLVAAWAEPMEEGGASGWVLRLHETLGCRGRARLRLAAGWRAGPLRLADRTAAAEQAGSWSVDDLEVVFGPYATISVGLIRPLMENPQAL